MPVGSEVPWTAVGEKPGAQGEKGASFHHTPTLPHHLPALCPYTRLHVFMLCAYALFNPLDNPHLDFHDGSAVKNLHAVQEVFNPWGGKIPWRRERLTTHSFTLNFLGYFLVWEIP